MVIAPDVRFIYFDFDNVLATRTQNRAALVAHRLGFSGVVALRHFYMYGFQDDPILHEQYQSIRSMDDEAAFYAAVFTQFAVDSGAAITNEMARQAAQEFLQIPFITDENAAAVLEQLVGKYRLGILTNGLPSRYQDIERSGLGQYFEAIVVSCDYGIEKPARAIYDKAIEVSRLSANELALIDDELANVRGAEVAGFGLAVLFTPAFWQQVLQA